LGSLLKSPRSDARYEKTGSDTQILRATRSRQQIVAKDRVASLGGIDMALMVAFFPIGVLSSR
jgi:hypothetical protein